VDLKQGLGNCERPFKVGHHGGREVPKKLKKWELWKRVRAGFKIWGARSTGKDQGDNNYAKQRD